MSRGVTLVELLVVLVLLGLLAGITGVAVTALEQPAGAEEVAVFEEARREAILTGRSVTVGSDASPLRFLPDGRAVGATDLSGLDPLTGRLRDGH